MLEMVEVVFVSERRVGAESAEQPCSHDNDNHQRDGDNET
jgi:hypothetical protein